MAFPLNFQNRLVVITGGTRGIGAAIAQAFASAGADVIVTGTSVLAPAGVTGRYYQLDFTDADSVANFSHYLHTLPVVDVLINNAGVNVIKTLDELSVEEFDRVNQVNARGPFILARAVAPGMRKRRAGSIVNIASIWSVAAKEKRSAYCSAKSGVAGLTRALAAELGPYGILVNAVSPGFTLTELTEQSLSDEEMLEIAARIPLGRMAKPDEIAQVVLFLASPQNSFMTGQNLIVDGGFTII